MYIFGPSTEWMLESNRIVIFCIETNFVVEKSYRMFKQRYHRVFFSSYFRLKTQHFLPQTPNILRNQRFEWHFVLFSYVKPYILGWFIVRCFKRPFPNFCAFLTSFDVVVTIHIQCSTTERMNFHRKMHKFTFVFPLSCTICELIMTNRDRHKHTQIPQSIDLFPPTNEHFLSYERKLQKMKSHWAYLFSLSLVCNEQRNH